MDSLVDADFEETPLLVKTSKENPDVYHIIREVFRDALCGESISKNIKENLQKYKPENVVEEFSAANTNDCTLDEVSSIEKKVMTNQAESIIGGNHKTEQQRNFGLLKRNLIFKDLDLADVKKYNLIQANDLLPSLPEQKINFQINLAKIGQCNCDQYKIDYVPVKLKDESRVCNHETCKRGIPESSRKRKLQRKSGEAERYAEQVLIPIPERITFCNYEINTVYKQSFKVRNVSRATRTFTIRPLRLNSRFKVDVETFSNKLAPGISATFKVTFKTESYKDVDDEVILNVSNGSFVRIQLHAYRNSPILRGFVMQPSNKIYYKVLQEYFEENNRHVAVNSTLDCGFCFIGNTNCLNILLKNEGGSGTFFLMSEMDWYSENVNDVSPGMVLTNESFEIYPAHFQINEDEILDLQINFFPTVSGLHVAKIFFLCDNCAFQEIDIIGDGVFYESNSVTIDLMDKDELVLSNDTAAKKIIDFGISVPNSVIRQIIPINNSSCMDLYYRWEIRSCNKENQFSDKKLHRIKKKWIKIHPQGNCLPAYSVTEFTLEINTDCGVGKYGCVLGFIITNIPQSALQEEKLFQVYETVNNENSATCSHILDIVIEEIEIVFSCVSIEITIYPENIAVPYINHDSGPIIREITVATPGLVSLDCEWIRQNHETKCVQIRPKTFSVSPIAHYICEVYIHFKDYEDVNETFRLSVNRGIYEQLVNVRVTTEKPTVALKPDFVNFGYVKRNAAFRKTLIVENKYNVDINWSLDLFVYNATIHRIEKGNNASLSAGKGTFRNGKHSSEVTFTLDTSQQGKFLAFILLTTYHPSGTTTNGISMIVADITKPNLQILAPKSDHGILCLDRILYLGIPSTHKIHLYNNSELCCGFIWGNEQLGVHREFLDLGFHRRSGCVNSYLSKEIEITITPIKVGFIDELYIPCYVSSAETVFLRIMCVVDDMKVKILLPNREGEFRTSVTWPDEFYEVDTVQSDIEKYLKITDVSEGMESEEIEICEFTYTECEEIVKTKRHMDKVSTDDEHCVTPELKTENSLTKTEDLDTSVSKEWYDLEERNFIERLMEEDEKSEEVNLCCVAPTNSEEGLLIPLQNVVENHPDIVLEKYSIEIRNVAAGKATKINFAIENITPVAGKVSLKSKNFYALPKKSVLESVIAKMSSEETDWEDLVQYKYGIVVILKPNDFQIGSFEYKEIEIWVYGNTWGTYMDKIECHINKYPIFSFDLLIEIIGYPLEFPFARNTITDGPLLRLGLFPFASMYVKRHLRVQNTSSIPVTVVWHVFICSEDNISSTEPFNFLIDFFGHSNSREFQQNEMHAMITNYYGKEDFELIQITPKESTIKPNSSVPVAISLNPYDYLKSTAKYTINAVLIGQVYIENAYRLQDHCMRQENPPVVPTVIKITGDIELPYLDFELLGGDVDVDIYATDVIASKNYLFSKESRLVFRNKSKTFTLVSLKAEKPLSISRVITEHSTFCMKSPAIIVAAESYMELYVDCSLPIKTIEAMAEWLYIDSKKEEQELTDRFSLHGEDVLKITSCLHIYHGGVRKQFVLFHINVFFPLLTIDNDHLDFGVVFVGNDLDLIVNVTNKVGCATPFRVIASNPEAFKMEPEAGVIPAGCVNGTTLEIRVIFKPNKSAVFKEYLQIESNIPHFQRFVMVNGVGSHNEKYRERIRE